MTYFKDQKKYKYNIGDKVSYWDTVYTEKVCECCGNTETDFKRVKREGIIKSRKMELIYRMQDMVATSSKKLPNGQRVYEPYIPEIRIQEPEPTYVIDKETFTEDRIIKRLWDARRPAYKIKLCGKEK